MRGRVISFYAMAFFGMQPIGGLIVGGAAEMMGAPPAIFLQGVATLLIGVGFFPFLRRDIVFRKQREKIMREKEKLHKNPPSEAGDYI